MYINLLLFLFEALACENTNMHAKRTVKISDEQLCLQLSADMQNYLTGFKSLVNFQNITFCFRALFHKKVNLAEMEGYIVTITGEKRPIVSPERGSPAKRTNFVGISPQKELTNITTPTDRPFRVSVEGNIGAGKSTLIRYFSNFPGIETNPEPIEWWRNLDGHNLLDLLYTDINKWYNTFQMYVQLTRLKVQTTPPKSSSTTVQMFERSVQNNRYCFVEQAHKSGILHGADYAIINEWYRWARKNCDIDLDLIVYLRSTPEVVFNRIKARRRPEEVGVKLQYLQELHDSHERWLMSDDLALNTVPVLVLDADKTLEEIIEQYRLNETKILGHDKKGTKPVLQEDKNRVKKVLDLGS